MPRVLRCICRPITNSVCRCICRHITSSVCQCLCRHSTNSADACPPLTYNYRQLGGRLSAPPVATGGPRLSDGSSGRRFDTAPGSVRPLARGTDGHSHPVPKIPPPPCWPVTGLARHLHTASRRAEPEPEPSRLLAVLILEGPVITGRRGR